MKKFLVLLMLVSATMISYSQPPVSRQHPKVKKKTTVKRNKQEDNIIYIVDADKVSNKVRGIEMQNCDNTARGTVTQDGRDDITVFRTVEEKVVVRDTESELIGEKPDSEKVYKVVEYQASFPGGPSAMMKWIANNIRYPETSRQNNIEGRVTVQFIIEKDGSISHAEVVKGVSEDLDREALRVIRNMPRWNPGKNNGHFVSSYFTLPVTFRISAPAQDE